ncbi:hypothetical protein LMF32_00990 [Desemzia sp. C1]|uniref:DUF6877 family protein n=1 Tax=Desemzia sp. C1 TaxID=2892016 RepID=UPI001E3D6B35|nr:DUF6877 family protein [Desemzia sp. C1]MCI3027712.1 hypothetical protein [Desemzia sp. C1]
MSYAAEILSALENVPNDISIKVLADVNQRINDWLASGGKDDDPYIQQQVRFAENVAKSYERRMAE